MARRGRRGRRGRFGGPTARCGAAAAAALLLAGCSSGSGGGSGGGRFGGSTGAAGAVPDTVAAALSAVPTTGWDTGYLEFGDVAAITALDNGSPGSGPAQAYIGIGESSLAETGDVAVNVLGFDPLKAKAAVTVGRPPTQAAVLYGGYDASAIGKKLTAAGFKEKGTSGGGTLYALGADNQLDPNNPTDDPQLNVLWVSSTRIVYGMSTADVDTLATPTGATLASNTQIEALAQCLGAAKGAVIGGGSTEKGSSLVAIGLTGTSASDATEEVCVLAKDSATAQAIGSSFAQKIRSGRSQTRDEPWSQLLTDPQSSVVSSSPAVVRLTAQPVSGQHPGILLEAYFGPQTDFSTLITP